MKKISFSRMGLTTSHGHYYIYGETAENRSVKVLTTNSSLYDSYNDMMNGNEHSAEYTADEVVEMCERLLREGLESKCLRSRSLSKAY